jgi:hypothetical protein
MNLEHLEKEGERKVAALFAADAPNVGTPNVGTPNVGTPNVGTPNVGTGTLNVGTGALNEGALLAIIDEGNDAFKSVHGRNMTYAEMREMYG